MSRRTKRVLEYNDKKLSPLSFSKLHIKSDAYDSVIAVETHERYIDGLENLMDTINGLLKEAENDHQH